MRPGAARPDQLVYPGSRTGCGLNSVRPGDAVPARVLTPRVFCVPSSTPGIRRQKELPALAGFGVVTDVPSGRADQLLVAKYAVRTATGAGGGSLVAVSFSSPIQTIHVGLDLSTSGCLPLGSARTTKSLPWHP